MFTKENVRVEKYNYKYYVVYDYVGKKYIYYNECCILNLLDLLFEDEISDLEKQSILDGKLLLQLSYMGSAGCVGSINDSHIREGVIDFLSGSGDGDYIEEYEEF